MSAGVDRRLVLGPSDVLSSTRMSLPPGMRPAVEQVPIEWRVERDQVDYEAALASMETRAAAIADGSASELVSLLVHPSLYTAGTSAKPDELLAARFPVHAAGRGGQFTYHGPGQRVVYLMLDLRRRGSDVRLYVATLEQWIIRALAGLGVVGECREDRVGVWVRREEQGAGREDKIAAIGIRVKRWVSLHGIALNVDCDLSHFSGIVPCGIRSPLYGVTSLVDLGVRASMAEVDAALRSAFEPLFGKTQDDDQMPAIS